MSALSSNMWAGMGTLDEIQRGTLNRFLTTPVSRAALMNGNVVNNGLITALQSVIIVLLGLLGGADYPGGIGGIAILIAASVLLGTIFGALSNALGMLVRERESIIGINTFLLLPLTFSSAFMAPSQMPADAAHRRLQSAQLGHGGGAFGDVRAPRLGCRGRPLGALLALAVAAVWLCDSVRSGPTSVPCDPEGPGSASWVTRGGGSQEAADADDLLLRLHLRVPVPLGGLPAVLVVPKAPVAGDRQVLARDLTLDPQQPAQLLHEARLAVHERLHPARREVEGADGLHQGLAERPVPAVAQTTSTSESIFCSSSRRRSPRRRGPRRPPAGPPGRR